MCCNQNCRTKLVCKREVDKYWKSKRRRTRDARCVHVVHMQVVQQLAARTRQRRADGRAEWKVIDKGGMVRTMFIAFVHEALRSLPSGDFNRGKPGAWMNARPKQ